MWAVIAMVVFLIATMFDYRWLRTFAWPIYFVNVGLLILTLRSGRAPATRGRRPAGS
jgi:cell division protein FtsW